MKAAASSMRMVPKRATSTPPTAAPTMVMINPNTLVTLAISSLP